MSRPIPSPRRAFDERYALVLVGADAVVCAVAVLAAYWLRCRISEPFLAPMGHPITVYLPAIPAVIGLWLITFHGFDLYRMRRFISPVGEMTAVFTAVTLTALMVAAASFLSYTDYSRAMLFFFWGWALPMSLASRALLRQAAIKLRLRGEGRARAVVVGCGELARLVARRVRQHHVLGYELVGFAAVDQCPADVEGYPVLGRLDDLPEVIRAHRIDEVLVARPDIDPGALMAAVQACEGLTVEFHLVAGPLQVITEQAELSGLADLPVIELPTRPFPRRQYAVKRLLDLIASLLLIILLAPVMLVIALLVRRETGSSAIFRQTRIGHRGVPFTMFKFRTMIPQADPYADAPRRPEDERITRTGRWLRRSSLDELPQLFNVIRGDMSLVGPRPEMPHIVEEYEPWQRRRLDVKPGMTGLWQVLGRKDLPLRENLQYDFYYIRNWSIWLDLMIVFKTIPVVIAGRGAY